VPVVFAPSNQVEGFTEFPFEHFSSFSLACSRMPTKVSRCTTNVIYPVVRANFFKKWGEPMHTVIYCKV
jgi:hypothetical protein